MPAHPSPQATLHQETGTNDPAVEQAICRHLPDDPASALALLPNIPCENKRIKIAILIAQSWARQDINTAWNAVARSPLNATEKQLMFNELWG
jgi:predicted acyl esterase